MQTANSISVYFTDISIYDHYMVVYQIYLQDFAKLLVFLRQILSGSISDGQPYENPEGAALCSREANQA